MHAGRDSPDAGADVIEACLLAAVALVVIGAVCGYLAVVSLASLRHEDIEDMDAPDPDRPARGREVYQEDGYWDDPPDRSDQEWW